MAKKKKHHKKKSQYKASKRPVATAADMQLPDVAANAPAVVRPAQAENEPKKKQDNKRSLPVQDSGDRVVAQRARREVTHALILAGAIMLGLIALWCLFAFTSVGLEIYKLIRI